MKNWPSILKLFERFVPITAKMDIHFKPSDKIILEHFVLAYHDYKRGEKAPFKQWCDILIRAIPTGIEKPEVYDTVLAIIGE